MKSEIVILDAGHGGLIGGAYPTPGKRSPAWSRGVLYEGAANRWIVNEAKRLLDLRGVPYFDLAPEPTDVPLRERVRRANKIYAEVRNVYVASIHHNAGGGTGIEGFTSRGETRSDAIATSYLTGLEPVVLRFGMRLRYDVKDGDPDKEAAFYILRKTRPPAILLELGFMDHPHDYELIIDPEFAYGRACAESIAETAARLYLPV